MPGPVIFGAAFDGACTLWYTACGSEGGSCFHYDNSYLGYAMLAINGSLKVGSCLCMFFAWWLYKPPPPEEDIVKVVEADIDDAEEADQKDMDDKNEQNELTLMNNAQNGAVIFAHAQLSTKL